MSGLVFLSGRPLVAPLGLGLWGIWFHPGAGTPRVGSGPELPVLLALASGRERMCRTASPGSCAGPRWGHEDTGVRPQIPLRVLCSETCLREWQPHWLCGWGRGGGSREGGCPRTPGRRAVLHLPQQGGCPRPDLLASEEPGSGAPLDGEAGWGSRSEPGQPSVPVQRCRNREAPTRGSRE